MERQELADTDEFSRQTERLEAALDRIALLAAHSRASTPAIAAVSPIPSAVLIDTAAVTDRLDSLITRLRDAVGNSH